MARLSVARRTRNVCFFERLASVPDRHFSDNIIYQDQHHFTSVNKVMTSTVSIGKRMRRKNSSTTGGYFLVPGRARPEKFQRFWNA